MANKATLVNPEGEKKVVETGSQEAQELFSEGFELQQSNNSTPDVPEGATKITGEGGLEGLGEQDIWRDPSSEDIYQLPDSVSAEDIGDEDTDVDTQQNEIDNQVDAFMEGIDTSREGLRTMLEQTLKPSDTEKSIEDRRKEVENLYQQFEEKPEDFQEQLDEYGFGENVKEVQDLTAEMERIRGEYTRLAQETQDLPIESRIIGGRVDQIKRQQSVEMGNLAQVTKALQGNVDMAMNIAKETTQIKYEPLERQIENQRYQIDQLYNKLQTEEKRKADAIKRTLAERERIIQREKETENQIAEVMTTASQNGANKETLKKIRNSGSYAEAVMNADNTLSEEPEVTTDPKTGNASVYNPNTGKYEPIVGTKEVTSLNNDELDVILMAMAEREGFLKDENNRPTRNNNPLNIKVPKGGIEVARERYNDPNATVEEKPAQDGGHFIKFSTPEKGWEAGKELLTGNYGYRNLTVDKALKRWSGGGYDSQILNDTELAVKAEDGEQEQEEEKKQKIDFNSQDYNSIVADAQEAGKLDVLEKEVEKGQMPSKPIKHSTGKEVDGDKLTLSADQKKRLLDEIKKIKEQESDSKWYKPWTWF